MNIQAIKFVASRAGLVLKKYAPEILLGVGITAGVGATATAIHTTIKNDVAAEIQEYRNTAGRLNDIKARYEEENPDELPAIRKEVAIGHIQAATIFAKNMVKIYAVPVALTAISIGSLMWSRGIYAGRMIAMSAALNKTTETLNAYRERVRGDVGEESEQHIFERAVDDVAIDEPEEEEGDNHSRISGYAPMSVIFDDSSYLTDVHNRENVLYMLKSHENWANDRLVARGHLFLNDVLVDIGLPQTPEGQLVGWIFEDDNQRKIDFGMNRNGFDAVICDYLADARDDLPLQFNVDGVIFDRI